MLRRIKPTRRQLREAFVSGYKRALKHKRFVKESYRADVEKEIEREWSKYLFLGLCTVGQKVKDYPESAEELAELVASSGRNIMDKYINKAYRGMVEIKSPLEMRDMKCVDLGVRQAVIDFYDEFKDEDIILGLEDDRNAVQDILIDKVIELVNGYIDRKGYAE